VASDLYQPNCGNNSEPDLIKRAQAGDAEAFCLLAQAFERRVYLLALHYCRHQQDAEDLSQEVWLKAYGAISTYRGEASFYTWLRKIMINCFLNHRRSRSFFWANQPAELGTIETVEEHRSHSLETDLEIQLALEKVMRALGQATQQQRLTFLLKHHEGMTYEEIAHELGCSAGTVKKSIARTLAKLKQQLDSSESTECSSNIGEYQVGSLGNA
jgi:RNA polymerase sigma-70 factor (ECF subfamily)